MDKFLLMIKNQSSLRPLWMNIIWVFCLYMTFIYMPFDLFYKPVELDEEVWFGFTLYGWYAKATEPLHWFIYGAGAYGFWKMKSWMWPWASLYCLQVSIAFAVYVLLNGGSVYASVVSGLVFLIPTVMLYRSRDVFGSG